MSKEQGQCLLSRSCYTHGHGKADGGDNCKVNFYYQLQLYIIFDGDGKKPFPSCPKPLFQSEAKC